MEQRTLHSIAQDAVGGLEVSGEGIRLTQTSATILRERVVLASGSSELEWVVRSLLIVAARLSDRGAEEAANTLVEIACLAVPSMSRLASEQRAHRHQKESKKTSQFLGAAQLRFTVPKTSTPNRVVADRLNRTPRRA